LPERGVKKLEHTFEANDGCGKGGQEGERKIETQSRMPKIVLSFRSVCCISEWKGAEKRKA